MKKVLFALGLVSAMLATQGFAADPSQMCTINLKPEARGLTQVMNNSCFSVVMYNSSTGDKIGYPLGDYPIQQYKEQTFTFACPAKGETVVFRVLGLFFESAGINSCDYAGSFSQSKALITSEPISRRNIMGPYYTEGQSFTADNPVTFDITVLFTSNFSGTKPTKPWSAKIDFNTSSNLAQKQPN